MKIVTLQFPTTHSLWMFRKTISLVWLRVNRDSRTLTCECFPEDTKIAIALYGAKIVETESPVGLNQW
ncbi:MAG: hypothetical protein ACXVDU_16870 [Bacteroidia bacterium]